MPVTSVVTDTDALTMTVTADFAAPVERLWKIHTDPRQLERFWGPPGWPATFHSFDFTVGGLAQYRMTGPHGETAGGRWEFLGIDEPRGFSVLDSFADADGNVEASLPSMRMVFRFEATADGSRMTNTSTFASLDALEQVIAMGAVEGTTLAMAQIDAVLQDLRAYAQGTGTRTELLDDTHVRITRLVEGSRELVWRAYTDAALIPQWILGPDGWVMTRCAFSLETGGSNSFAWAPDGVEGEPFGFEGETLLVVPSRRIVSTERMAGTEGPETVNDIQFYEEDGATLLTVLIEYPDRETRDMILATGMTDGMEASYARLEGVIAALA